MKNSNYFLEEITTRDDIHITFINSKDIYNSASRYGSLIVLEWARENNTYSSTVEGVYLKMVKIK